MLFILGIIFGIYIFIGCAISVFASQWTYMPIQAQLLIIFFWPIMLF